MTITPSPASSHATANAVLTPAKRLERTKQDIKLAEFMILVSSHAIGQLVVTDPLPERAGRLIRACWRRLLSARTFSARLSLPVFPSDDIIRSIELTFRYHYVDMFDFTDSLVRTHFDFPVIGYPTRHSSTHNSELASRLLEGHHYAHSINSETGAVQRFQHPIIYDIIERSWFFCPVDEDIVDQTLHNMPSLYFKNEAYEIIPHRTVALVLTVIEITLVTQYLGNYDDPVDMLFAEEGRERFTRNLKVLKMHESATAQSGESPNFATIRAAWYAKAAAQNDPTTF